MTPLSRTTPIVGLCAMLVGCAGVVSGVTSAVIDKFLEPGSTSIEATLEASPGLNPDPYGAPRSLVFRTYWLTSAQAFTDADYQALYQDFKDALGDDLLVSEELRILPGETRTEIRTVTPNPEEGTRLYLGVLAAYRDHTNARWRASVPLELHEKNAIRIRFEDLSVFLESAEN